MAALCVVCQINPPTGQMFTCANCRASMHRWEKRAAGEILQRSTNLRVWAKRMQQFAVVDEDREKVTKLSHEQLVDKRIMMFRGLKRRVASNVARVKGRSREKKRTADRPNA